MSDSIETAMTPMTAIGLTPHDRHLQEHLLQRVSRTFALTIPELPQSLADVVANAYLLCRIADTIEDEYDVPSEQKMVFFERFNDVLSGKASIHELARDLLDQLTHSTPDGEQELIARLADVIAIYRRFGATEQAAMRRCVRIMVQGMHEFDGGKPDGLRDIATLERYCYFVAGVVGEMLTELFCAHSASIASANTELSRLAVRFGIGLQLTNILKDRWEDRHRGACWLPGSLLIAENPLATPRTDTTHPTPQQCLSDEGFSRLIGLARGHLQAALEYVLLIPPSEHQVRRFCLRALGLAVVTLQKIHRRRNCRTGNELKIKRTTVKAVLLATDKAACHDRLLRRLFAIACIGLPLEPDRSPLRVPTPSVR